MLAPSKPHAATAQPSPTSGSECVDSAKMHTGFVIGMRKTTRVRCVIFGA
jgi:hypothetical protein